jgi:raffinose/stachyose/melibiose transport system permease protein
LEERTDAGNSLCSAQHFPDGRPQAGRDAHVLAAYTLVALGPMLLIVVNSLKEQSAIFDTPFSPPTAETLSLEGCEEVFVGGDFSTYFYNSTVVAVVSILLVLLFASMAAFALTEYRFRLGPAILTFLAVGVMIPIRLGTVSILRLMASLGLVNTLTGLILVYTAMSLPLAVVLLAQYLRHTSVEIREAARVDGASEYRVFRIVLPLMRPGLAAVAVVSMLPIWNDLWFPLIIAPSPETTTVTLGVQQFVGQYVTNWTLVLAALTAGSAPLVVLYLLFSRQLVSGLTAGSGR